MQVRVMKMLSLALATGVTAGLLTGCGATTEKTDSAADSAVDTTAGEDDGAVNGRDGSIEYYYNEDTMSVTLAPYEDFYYSGELDGYYFFDNDDWNSYYVTDFRDFGGSLAKYINDGTVPYGYDYFNLEHDIYDSNTVINNTQVIIAIKEYSYNGPDHEREAYILIPYTDSWGNEDAVRITFDDEDYIADWTLDDVRDAASQILCYY